ncbi:hypothetical protein BGX26_004644 [Mortierella sp. AD094]|nr:hypothetical protein BGX26_004644 [Mortierella sp. AD094]
MLRNTKTDNMTNNITDNNTSRNTTDNNATSNTTDNLLTLFCLVDGESLSNAFEVEVPSTKRVATLKDAIKAKIPDTFNGVDAKDLSLWRVTIPENKQSATITIDGFEHKTGLDKPRTPLSELLRENPDDNTYIIVQRPPPVHAPVPARAATPHAVHARDVSRPSTPIPTIFIPQGQIEAELADILEGVSHAQTTSVIDPKEVEESQRGKLGRFYKRPLPYHETAANISLVMLGLELDKQAKTSEGETLREIVDNDVGRSSDHRVVAMVAPSGSGKTATGWQ